MVNVNKGRLGSVMWIIVTCTETVVSAAGFTALVHVCGFWTIQVRRYTIVLF